MSSILAAILSPAKQLVVSDIVPSSVTVKPTMSSRKVKRRSLPDNQRRRSMKFQQLLDKEGPSPSPSKSPRIKTPVKKPAKSALDAAVSPEEALQQPAVDANQVSDEEALNEDVPDEQILNKDAVDDTEYTFEKFVSHRWVDSALEIEVEWEIGERTWEPEAALFQDVPDAVLEYWESRGGRPPNPLDPDLFDIHAIRKHSRDRKKLLVEWVGFRAEDATWMPREAVEEAEPELLGRYWESVKGSKPRKRRRRG